MPANNTDRDDAFWAANIRLLPMRGMLATRDVMDCGTVSAPIRDRSPLGLRGSARRVKPCSGVGLTSAGTVWAVPGQ